MTPEEALRWVDERMHKDPYWAQTEFDVRRIAAEVINTLYGKGEPYVEVAVSRPSEFQPSAASYYVRPFSTLRFTKHELKYVGGLEGLLLVEEQVRRAMGVSP